MGGFLPQRPIISWLCAWTVKKTLCSHFPYDLVQSVCALHKHEAFALSQHVLRPYSSRNLDVVKHIYVKLQINSGKSDGMCIWPSV